MTRQDEYAFLAAFTSAMNHSGSVRALDVLWKDYAAQINACSPEGRKELCGLRARRSAELMSKGAA